MKTGFDDSAEARATAAVQFLTAGDVDGLAWRRSVWKLDGDVWRLTRTVLNACSAALIATGNDDGLGPALETAARQIAGFDPGPPGSLVHYSDLLDGLLQAAVGRRTPPGLWSEQVKSGHS